MNRFFPWLVALLLVGCGNGEGNLFKNPSPEETGITFQNTLSPTADLNILDYLYFYNGGGVAVGDINGDELPDIFFSGNQVGNKLYLNQGNLQFSDITESAGVSGNSSWNTGAVMADVNGDGLLDIYVCAVVGINGFIGYNELYINQGNNTFLEKASDYGLDFDTYSSSAAFLDYDLDGDLDMYLLNHAVHTQESYGHANLREKRNLQTGDKLLKNEGGMFTDVSEEAGIYGGVNAYGLGVAVADFNNDGYPDIYVGNDFHEDDYYYINNGDGTFTERLKDYFGYTTRFSMGNDATDVNHDGWPDLISLDMLPEDEVVLKSSEGDDDIQTQKMRTKLYGYHYQFTRNMLYLNKQQGGFSEEALQRGVAATDWSWSALFGDYNQDGEQDLFISNGIPKRPNDLDFINFVSSDQISNKINTTKLVDQDALDLMPSGAINNYIFEGDAGFFTDKSKQWIKQDTLISAASAYGDLDNDGDLDIITNNLNSTSSLYINQTNDKANYLKLKFNYPGKNRLGYGTKVLSYHHGILQAKELFTTRGFQASSEPIIHFGYGDAKQIDSLIVIWPNRTYQTLYNVPVNSSLTIQPENTKPFNFNRLVKKSNPLFAKIDSAKGIVYTHSEDNFVDFNRQKLMPYMLSDRGPAVAIGDLNADGRKDLFFGGSRGVPSTIFYQGDTTFYQKKLPVVLTDSIKEDVSAIIEDFDGDGNDDLFVGVAGGNFFEGMEPLLDSYYLQKENTFVKVPLPEYFSNTSMLKANDYDKDGDMDLFVGNQSISNDFGKLPTSFLLENRDGQFSLSNETTFSEIGMLTDAVWDDFDSDGWADLILVGEWMSPRFFKGDGKKFTEVKLLEKEHVGLWQHIEPFDIDQDGDIDYLLGNWGLNSKFKASDNGPLRMYYSDFDENGTTETVIAMENNGDYFPIEGLDDLSKQMISLRKKFTTYKDFAGKTIEQVFDPAVLKKAMVYELNELRSGYLENANGSFTFVPFGPDLQVAPIMTMLTHDFDKDGNQEVLAAGNYFGVKPYHGRFSSFPGALIKTKNDVHLGHQLGLDLVHKSARDLSIIDLNNQAFLLVTFNNDEAQVYEF